MISGHTYMYGLDLRAQPDTLREFLDEGLRIICYPSLFKDDNAEHREEYGYIAIAEKKNGKYIIKSQNNNIKTWLSISAKCSDKEFFDECVKISLWFQNPYTHLNKCDWMDDHGKMDKSQIAEIQDYIAQCGFMRSYGLSNEERRLSPFCRFRRDFQTFNGEYTYKKGDVYWGVQVSSIIDPFSYETITWKEFFEWLYS